MHRLQQSAIASVMKDHGPAPPPDQRLAATPTGAEQEAAEAEVEGRAKPSPSLTPPALPLKLSQQPPHKSPFFPSAPGEAGGGAEAGAGAVSGAGSPLQRMASITNSLVTTPPSVSFGCPSRANLKTALPPITQQQFDR